MNNSSAVIAIIILACVVIYYQVRKAKLLSQARKKKDYEVPLSDDVQHIYYDEYQKKMNELKQEKEDVDKERTANHTPESQDTDDHSDTTAA
ncbi:MAG: hypothetical protein SOI44_00820 [Lactimicrobium sp.]|jgi:hypothetical protein|uniref:hypothetical protein n=1 Tax=Lactimicrobium sp. TaxID=2563780 RepID=UPI002F35C4D3